MDVGAIDREADGPELARTALTVIFDSDYYLRANPEIAQSGLSPLAHFLSSVGAHARNPCALFDVAHYIAHHPDAASSGLNPLVHYVSKGARYGASVSPLFDAAWYLDKNPDIADAARANPLAHYLAHGAREGRSANPLFDQAWYLERYPNAAKEASCPLAHYAEFGFARRLSPHPLFDGKFYLEEYPDIEAAGLNPLAHFLMRGHLETRNPQGNFDTAFYLREYPDVAAESINPLVHYAVRGWKEKRKTRGSCPRNAPPAPGAPIFDKTAGKSPRDIVDLIKAAARVLTSPAMVSVVIPVYQQLPFTLRCVLSVLESNDRTPFEIIIVDDASPDGSGDYLERELAGTQGLRVNRNAKNLGFLRSCNSAAQHLSTEFIYFLNNDTVVLDGWLDELISTFRRHPETGLAGAKLIYPDGRLQEAGGIIWADASGANFGRGDDPNKPEYNYQRDVDYISGAAIMVPRLVWEELGGFSDEFAPAYYEDTDFAMKVRESGRRTLYQPLAMVVHYEGISSGTDITKGVKHYQEINRETFFDKWKYKLTAYGSNADFSRNIVDRRPQARILVFDAETPTPDKDSGSVTAFYYLRLLSELGHRVTFVPQNLLKSGRYGCDLQRLGVEVVHTPFETDSRDYVLRNADRFDMFVLSRAPIGGQLIDELRAACPNAPIIFDTVDLHHLRVQRQYELEGRPELAAQARELKTLELNAIRKANLTILVSEYEARYLTEEIGPFAHTVIPLIYEPYLRTTGFEERRDFVFVGGYRHQPNIDAVRYLTSEIWPRFKVFGTDARLHIVGSHCPPEFDQLACDDIMVTGFVPNLEQYMGAIRVSLAPLRYGAGVKGKVGNSLRLGVPVIGTKIALEGMGLIDSEHVLMANDPASFAAAMRELYMNGELWERISEQGQSYVSQRFGLSAARSRLNEICTGLLRASGVS